MTAPPGSARALIDELVASTGEVDAPAAIRRKARELIDLAIATFGDEQTPPDINVLASLRGIVRSHEPPMYSADAELVPDGRGGVAMRVNPDRPETRQRFSIAHEITHTFFPHYTTKPWCRTDPRFRNRDDPDDFLEMLCDIGAAELLFPYRWFPADAANLRSAEQLIQLAKKYGASREATLRRYAELNDHSVVAAFFTWKLKPTEKRVIGRPEQPDIFGTAPEDQIRAALRLRVDYAIPSERFVAEGWYVPKEKSVDNQGPLYDAARTGEPCDGDCQLNLGEASGVYRVLAVPLWTPERGLGPAGENAVAAILQPQGSRKRKQKVVERGPSLFD